MDDGGWEGDSLDQWNAMSHHKLFFISSKHKKYLHKQCLHMLLVSSFLNALNIWGTFVLVHVCILYWNNITENKLILNNFYRTKRQSVYQPSPAIQLSITGHKLKEEKHFFLNLCWSFKYEELKSWSTCPLQDLPAVWYKATRDATDPRLPPSIYKEDKACFSRDYTFRRTKISWTVKMKNKACLGYVCTCFVQFSWKRQVFLG